MDLVPTIGSSNFSISVSFSLTKSLIQTQLKLVLLGKDSILIKRGDSQEGSVPTSSCSQEKGSDSLLPTTASSAINMPHCTIETVNSHSYPRPQIRLPHLRSCTMVGARAVTCDQ